MPGHVARSLAVDVVAHLGPSPAALRVHAHVAGVSPGAVVLASTYRHARAVRGHRYRCPNSSPAASPSMSDPTWVHVPPLSAYTRTWPAALPCASFHKRRSPRACRPRTSTPTTRTGRPQPRRRCRRPPGPKPHALRVHAHVAGVSAAAVVVGSAYRHARAVRGHRYRVPGLVARSLAVDVGAHLGPRPAALGVHPHVAGL